MRRRDFFLGGTATDDTPIGLLAPGSGLGTRDSSYGARDSGQIGLMIMALTFGTMQIENFQNASLQLTYALVFFVVLAC